MNKSRKVLHLIDEATPQVKVGDKVKVSIAKVKKVDDHIPYIEKVKAMIQRAKGKPEVTEINMKSDKQVQIAGTKLGAEGDVAWVPLSSVKVVK